MSRKYRSGDEVPLNVLAERLKELAIAVTDGSDAINREFTMRIPPELDRDADLVLAHAAIRLKKLQSERDELKIKLERLEKNPCLTCNGYGAVGDILNADDCPDCASPISLAEIQAKAVEDFVSNIKQLSFYNGDVGDEVVRLEVIERYANTLRTNGEK